MSAEPCRPVAFNMDLAAAVLNKADIQVLDMPVLFSVLKLPSLFVMYGGVDPAPRPKRRMIRVTCEPYKWMPAEKHKLAHEINRVTVNANLQIVMESRQLLTIRPETHAMLTPPTGLSLAASYNDLVTRVQAVLTDMGKRSETLSMNVSFNMTKFVDNVFDNAHIARITR